MKWIFAFIPLMLVQKCSRQDAYPFGNVRPIDVQGHRGCRGLMPENSIPAFLKALEIGVNTLEMDVVISGDGKVVVSHEPYFAHEIARDALGRDISEEDEPNHNIYQMQIADIQKYDCGTKYHHGFPDQLKIKTYKPTLDEVFQRVEQWIGDHQLPKVQYNIEIKRNPEYDGIYHPSADVFVQLVLKVIREYDLGNRVIIQSFDPESLETMRQLAPDIRLAFLVGEGEFDENIRLLSFKPEIYSPAFRLVDEKLVKMVHANGMTIIPWTVNETDDIRLILEAGVDGLISDYPDRVIDQLRPR